MQAVYASNMSKVNFDIQTLPVIVGAGGMQLSWNRFNIQVSEKISML